MAIDSSADEPADPLPSAERAELTRLRAEVAGLRAGRTRHVGRWLAVAVAWVLVAVLAFATVSARYVRGEILDTDRYVATVAPLSADPAVRDAVSRAITAEIFARVDIEGLTTDALAALSDSAADRPRVDRALTSLAPVLERQTYELVEETVRSYVASDRFAELWRQVNRAAHTAVVATVTGDGPESVTVHPDGTVAVSLGPMLADVRARLIERGFTAAERLPAVDAQFVLFRSPELVRVQRAVDLLDKAATLLPWVTIVVAAAAIVLAPVGRRRRAVAGVGVALMAGMALLALVLSFGRSVYLDSVPPDVLAPDAAAAVIDTLSHPLRTALRAVAGLGLVIALAAYVSGGSASAVALRGGFGRGAALLTRRAGTPRPWEIRAYGLRGVLRWAIVGVGAALLVFWPYPTGAVVVWIALGAVIALLALELLIRPGARTASNA